jgi:hypothetical protein
VEQNRYINPRKADWPQIVFIIGNPPFIGKKCMRDVLGGGYVEALRGQWDIWRRADRSGTKSVKETPLCFA